jgi:hypothetical protein
MTSSGIPYPAPREELPLFDARVFLPETEVLDYDTLKSLFITYPVAQGDVNLLDVVVGGTLLVADDITTEFNVVIAGAIGVNGVVFPDGTLQTTAGGGGGGGGPPFLLDITINDVRTGRGGVSNGASVPATNTSIGGLVAPLLTTGSSNVNVGYSAADSLTTGNQNTSVGVGSATNLTTGANNTSLGWNTCSSITTGNSNTCIGAGSSQSGNFNNTTALGATTYCLGNNSTAIGFGAGALANQIVLGTVAETVICRNTLQVVNSITSATPATNTNNTTVATTAFVNNLLGVGGGNYATQGGTNNFTGSNTFANVGMDNIDVSQVVSTNTINAHDGQSSYDLWTDVLVGDNINIGGSSLVASLNLFGYRFTLNNSYNLYTTLTPNDPDALGLEGLGLYFESIDGSTIFISYGGGSFGAIGGFVFKITSSDSGLITTPFTITPSGTSTITPATITNDDTVATTAFVYNLLGDENYATQAGTNNFTGSNSFEDVGLNNIDVSQVVYTNTISTHGSYPSYNLWTDALDNDVINIGASLCVVNITCNRFTLNNNFSIYTPNDDGLVNPIGEQGLALVFTQASGYTSFISYGGDTVGAVGGFVFKTTSEDSAVLTTPFQITPSGIISTELITGDNGLTISAGTTSVPTPTVGNDSTEIATTAFVNTAITNAIGGGGSGQGTIVSATYNIPALGTIVSGTTYPLSINLTSGIWLIDYSFEEGITTGTVAVKRTSMWLSLNTSQVYTSSISNSGQFAEILPSQPATSANPVPVNQRSSSHTLVISGATTIFQNYTTVFTAGFVSLLQLNIRATKIF